MITHPAPIWVARCQRAAALMDQDSDRLATSAQWLAQLRWVAVVGQLVTIGVTAGLLGVPLPVTPLLCLIALTAGTNTAFWWVVRRRRAKPADADANRQWRHLLGALMLLDLLVLTGMLGVTGGTTNPFAIFYFVNLALCGVLLPQRWAWLLGAVAIIAFGGLRCVHLPLPELLPPGSPGPGVWRLFDAGLLVAFAACAGVIVWFATRVTSELQRSDLARRRVEDLRARSEKLEALGTLAAGAAHELATPLSTIAVVAKELERELDASSDSSPETADDIRLIRGEVDRCRAILDRMSMRTGEAPGEVIAELPVRDLVEEVLDGLADRGRVGVDYQYAAGSAQITAARTALAQSVRAVVQNALDASPGAVDESSSEPDVLLTVGPALGGVELAISDRGAGMSPSVLQRAGEPFFTTKSPGKGMGLGLFLARSVIERLGGKLQLESVPGAGSTVRLKLPARILGEATDPAARKQPAEPAGSPSP